LSNKVLANGKIGFGVTAVDDNVSGNSNGVYKIEAFKWKPSFGYQFDSYSFDEMRYINALIDYSKYKRRIKGAEIIHDQSL
jgi:hypothetical protein